MKRIARWIPAGSAICAVTVLLLVAQHRVSFAADTPKIDEQFVLTEEPKGAVDVIALRASAKDQQDVIVVGRIGGKKNPWVRGVAAFPLVDLSLQSCDEKGHNCPNPWDFCCSSNLPKAMVLVMFVDDKGAVLKKDARNDFGLKELDTVVVQGKAKRDKAGNVVVVGAKFLVRSNHEAAK